MPSTTIPISINTINGNCTAVSHCGGGCCNSNSKYYVDNSTGTTVGYGGFTTVLKAESPVICGQTYHIDIAIADGGDPFYDSGVFLGGRSFRGGINPLNITVSPSDSICPNDKVIVFFPDSNPTITSIGHWGMPRFFQVQIMDHTFLVGLHPGQGKLGCR